MPHLELGRPLTPRLLQLMPTKRDGGGGNNNNNNANNGSGGECQQQQQHGLARYHPLNTLHHHYQQQQLESSVSPIGAVGAAATSPSATAVSPIGGIPIAGGCCCSAGGTNIATPGTQSPSSGKCSTACLCPACCCPPCSCHVCSSAKSTPCEPIAQSPTTTVLLSPVLLSRPIRSQSAHHHSPNSFVRCASAANSHPSDSESELLTAVCSSRAGSSGLAAASLCRQSSHHHHRLSNNNNPTVGGGSRPSNSSSPLATPPPMLGGSSSTSPLFGGGGADHKMGGGGGGSQAVSRSGSFSRHLLQQHSFGSGGSVGSSSGTVAGFYRTRASGGGGGTSGGGIGIARCHSFSRGQQQQQHCHYSHHRHNNNNNPSSSSSHSHYPLQQHPLQRQRAGTFSQHDSFESTTSAGESVCFPPHSSSSPYYSQATTAATIARRIGDTTTPTAQQQQQHRLPNPLVAGSCCAAPSGLARPPSAAAQLQRSQSDALDPAFSRHSFTGSSGRFPVERLLCISSGGFGSGGGGTPMTSRSGGGGTSVGTSVGASFRAGAGATALMAMMAQQQLQLQLQQQQQQQQPRRRPFTTSMRDLVHNDSLHLHSSLDSSGSYREQHPQYSSGIHANQYLCASSTTGTPTGTGSQQQQQLQLALLTAAATGQQQRSNNSANLMRLRYCPLGHSDPQIYTYTQTPFYVSPGAIGLLMGTGRYSNASGGRRSFLSASPQISKFQKDTFLISPSSNTTGAPKQLQQHGSPHGSAHGNDIIGGVRKSPVQMRMHRSSFSSIGSGGGHHHHHGHGAHHTGGLHLSGGTVGISSASSSARPSISAGCPIPGAPGGIIRQPVALRALPPGHHLENRRWSLASLPSSSGYGTPGTNSAYSSQYSSQENLAGLIGDLRIRDRFDSNESYSCCLGDDFGGFMRPRSRSLTSPVIPHLFDRLGLDTPLMSSVYKERFPKAKQQMENRLLQFLAQNAPLSGFTSQMLQLNIVPPSPMPGQQPSIPARPSSPRPQSPIPMRPLSPLVTESATAIGDSVIHRSSAQKFLSAGSGGSAASAGQQQISNQPAIFFGGSAVPQQQQEADQQQLQPPLTSRSSICCSPLVGVPAAVLTNSDTQLLRLLSDGATRFLHHQLCEIAADCLQKSRDDLLSCAYFCNMSVRLDETLAEAEVKVGPESFTFLTRVVKQILMMVSRTARLLECLEFNPDEFYQLLDDAEVAVREQLGAGSARVPDLPQYILTKLGLNKNLSLEQTIGAMNEEDEEQDHEQLVAEDDLERTPLPQAKPTLRKRSPPVFEHPPIDTLRRVITPEAPKEEDFETVRLVSNGAYGAVYLVKHKRTRQRFALKKMRKQTLILRNQIEQVFAERDILTFTDNPFVVCFYGSFETKHHLCMLMEYVEGGDCASLLKSAGTLPIELARLYVAETVLAIEYLHSCGIVHRDLKPDNLLITSIGHIKLTDFGLSKIGLMNRTTLVSEGYLLQDDTKQFQDNQLCGTPEYIAPEVILRQGYGKPVDWWALGVILYEFLVGIVPFLGDSPEALFANIINEEVEYPEGDEALDQDAESLIRMLLEKNPVDRLGTMGGAPQVSAHSFFAPIDFGTILRQKAEFVPQLENDEDTSYFDSRSERYNHDVESEAAEEDEQPPMFWSFSTASPRHSIVGLELPNGGLAMLQAAHAAAIERGQLLDVDDERNGENNNSLGAIGRATTPTASASSGIGSAVNSAFATALPSSSGRITTTGNCSDSQDSQSYEQHRTSKMTGVEFPGDVIPSAVILRRRFSNQRYANLSTSSSGTTGTGAGAQTNTNTTNTCSSTDSSLDAFHFDLQQQPRRSHGQLPRFAISPCAAGGISSTTGTALSDNLVAQAQHPPLQRGNGMLPDRRLSTTTDEMAVGKNAVTDQQYLSPVEEQQQLRRQSQTTTVDAPIRRIQQKRPSAVVHELITDANRIGQQQQQTTMSSTSSSNSGTLLSRHSCSGSCRTSITGVGTPAPQSTASISTSLRVQIPGTGGTTNSHVLSPQQQHSAPASTPNTAVTAANTTYYHSYGTAAQQTLSGSSGPHSPAPSCNSVSSVSSFDSQKQHHPKQQMHATTTPMEPTTTISGNTLEVHTAANQGRTSALCSPSSLLPPLSAHQIHRSSISGGQSRPIVIRKGAQGFGFTIRSVRVYLSEISEYYSIEHIVAAVREGSPAWEAGLRPNDLITHVHTQSVHNMTHPQLMHRLLSCGNELTVHVVPLASTSIKEGEPRRNVGKPLRKKPRKPTQPGGAKTGAGKQTTRAKNTSLFRRLSGKRGTGDIVPGTSSQKQTFMPRSVSSQEGVLATMPVAANNNNNNK